MRKLRNWNNTGAGITRKSRFLTTSLARTAEGAKTVLCVHWHSHATAQVPG